MVAVNADVVNVVAVVLAAPCDVPPVAVVLPVTNHSYNGAGVEPEPLAVAVNNTGWPEQIVVLSEIMLTLIVGTGVTVIVIGLEVTAAAGAHRALLVISTV